MANKAEAKPKSLTGNPAYILLGEFGRAHGLKGEIRLKSFTADPSAIADYDQLLTADGKPLAINSLRQAAGDQPDLLVARIEGINHRDQAEALNRVGIYMERARLPAPEEEGEFLHADLIGLKAVDPQGKELGTIKAIANYGGGDILEIEPGGLLVPFTRTFVPGVDIAQGLVVIDYAESVDEDDGDKAQ